MFCVRDKILSDLHNNAVLYFDWQFGYFLCLLPGHCKGSLCGHTVDKQHQFLSTCVRSF